MALVRLPEHQQSGGPGGALDVPGSIGAARHGHNPAAQSIGGVGGGSGGTLVNPNEILGPIDAAARASADAAKSVADVADHIGSGVQNRMHENFERQQNAELIEFDAVATTAWNDFKKALGPGAPNKWGDNYKKTFDRFYQKQLTHARQNYNRRTFEHLRDNVIPLRKAQEAQELQGMGIKRQASLDFTRVKYGVEMAVEDENYDKAISIVESERGISLNDYEADRSIHGLKLKKQDHFVRQAVWEDPDGDGEAAIQSAEKGVQASNVWESMVSGLKGFESYRSQGYDDEGRRTIGYGTDEQTPGEEISEPEAERRMRAGLSKARASVLDIAEEGGYEFNENQIAALTSFQYNGWDARQLLIENGHRSPEEIAAKLQEYVHGEQSGTRYKGLERRRKWEAEMFMGKGGTEPGPAPSGQIQRYRKLQETAKSFHRNEEIQHISTGIQDGTFTDDSHFYEQLGAMAYLSEKDQADMLDLWNGDFPGTQAALDLSATIGAFLNSPQKNESDYLQLKAAIAKHPTEWSGYLSSKLRRAGLEGEGGAQSSHTANLQRWGESKIDAILDGIEDLDEETEIWKTDAKWIARQGLDLFLETNPNADRKQWKFYLDTLEDNLKDETEAQGYVSDFWTNRDGSAPEATGDLGNVGRPMDKDDFQRMAGAIVITEGWKALGQIGKRSVETNPRAARTSRTHRVGAATFNLTPPVSLRSTPLSGAPYGKRDNEKE